MMESADPSSVADAAFTCAGAAVGPHARYHTVCSIDFAGGYVEADATAFSLLAHN